MILLGILFGIFAILILVWCVVIFAALITIIKLLYIIAFDIDPMLANEVMKRRQK